ncbi:MULTISPECIES: hypothetical protein [unclassified Bradyrhizobium]|nr:MULTISPECIES: hypothetical protein [unclassified Bradyrhizobium]
MLLLFRPFRIGEDIEVAKSLSLFMTELIAPVRWFANAFAQPKLKAR